MTTEWTPERMAEARQAANFLESVDMLYSADWMRDLVDTLESQQAELAAARGRLARFETVGSEVVDRITNDFETVSGTTLDELLLELEALTQRGADGTEE